MNRIDFLHHLNKKQVSKTDDKFTKQSLEGYEYLPKGISAEDLLTRIDQKIDSKTRSSNLSIRRQLPRLMSLAAAVLVLVVAGIWFLRDSSPTDSSTDLFSQYYTPLAIAIPNQGTDRGETQEYSYALSPVTEALHRYEQGDFKAANVVFASIPVEQKSEATNFYHSLSLLSVGEIPSAINLLEKLDATAEDIRYIENIKWYLALAYVKVDLQQKALPYLEDLQESKHFQHKASSLLSKLRL